MSTTRIKRDLALVGAGYWGKNLARNFNELGALHTICDQSESLLKQYETDDYSEVNRTSSLENILSNPEITKVAIAVPAALHFDLAKAALESGKDVFVEKPLCLDVGHGEELVRIAQEKGCILMVGHLLQYHPCIVKLQEMVGRGELGKLFYLTSNRLNLGKIRREENALWSFAPHDISVILSLVNHQEPIEVQCSGEANLSPQVADTTLTMLRFANGPRAHIYVSWLNPFKEQKLTVVGSQGMVVFDDSKPWKEKLVIHKDYLNWEKGQTPMPVKKPGVAIKVPEEEPLKLECQHFINCCHDRLTPKSDGKEGLSCLKVLAAAQQSLESEGDKVALGTKGQKVQNISESKAYFTHETAVVDQEADIGEGTKIWHFSHVLPGARIGKHCNLGQNVVVSDGVVLGDRTKVQNNVSIYSGVHCEEDVFLGPSCVMTNISNPRSQVNRKKLYEKTLIKKGASIGANATIVCGVTIGRYAFVAAGAVVTKNVPNYALVLGNPGKQVGWMSRHGHRLIESENKLFICPESGLRYALGKNGQLHCLDLDEDDNLPDDMSVGEFPYQHFKTI